ncbi:hypothetical protein SASPL_139089 [Salvia splendens]|uniref:Uncharacterized protein n=1 Tax=Salvia splendens TaxID=180675 RepID=A0A8X8WWR2_SALSN|nr:uncharacterized protein LOC121765180 [Salvia splendens]KAG6402214.1 hypothetical protein SASPL_139089 [Salvia splendens]
MGDSGNIAEEQKNPFVVFFTNLLSSIKLPSPPKKNGAKPEHAVEAAEPLKSAADDEKNPGFVTFPRQNVEQIKLEGEADAAGRTTNPLILWQVYALGGILVARWAWMRWNERKGQKKPDDGPPPSQD